MTGTPWGFRDILPEEARDREELSATVRGCLAASGYEPVETPLLEERSALAEGGRISDTPFKLFDGDGCLLVVRPDNTLPIVRLVSSRLRDASMPLRLRYEAPVVRERAMYTGVSRQFTQLGFELIGIGGAQGDVEIVLLVAEVIRALGLAPWRIVCSSVRPFNEMLALLDDEELARVALSLVHENNLVDLDALMNRRSVPSALGRAICELPRLQGDAAVLGRVDELVAAAGVTGAATQELRALAAGLARRGALAGGMVTFDFSIMNSFDYYTGLVLKAYAGNLTDPIGSGGRYDSVFDTAFPPDAGAPAAGFAFSLERIEAARAVRRQAADAETDYAVAPRTGAPLRICVPKGGLARGAADILEAAGLDVGALRDPGRRLVVRSGDRRAGVYGIGEVEFVIVRAADAPSFVACGGADCGICGRDSLLEANLDLLQLVDLGFGACRFVEAEPASRAGCAQRTYARRGSLRVATKYPRIAGAWYARQGVSVDIVALHGNIELGPIVGMTDRIVDITASGTTLVENDLVVTAEIMACTARYFVNPGRARWDPRVSELGDRLQALAPEASREQGAAL